MSETERLRALLDERGVEWEDNSPVPSMKPWKTSFMSFTGEEVTLSCYDEPKWIMGTLVFYTPEQAIAATLGPCSDSCSCTNGERTGERTDLDPATLGDADLAAENAKLRGLVADMYAVISRNNSWWDWARKDTRRFADRMCELGIEGFEVDDG